MSTPPTSLPFAEVKYFDSTSAVRRHLMAAPRALIQTALDRPNAYLDATELLDSQGSALLLTQQNIFQIQGSKQ